MDDQEEEKQRPNYVATFVQLLVLGWSLAVISWSYFNPNPTRQIDTTFAAGLLSGVLTQFGVDLKSKNGDKKKTVSYLDFEAWDSGATTLNKYCKKGDIVDLVASARNNSWVDKEGNKKFQIRFRVKEFKLFNNNYGDTTKTEDSKETVLDAVSDTTDE